MTGLFRVFVEVCDIQFSKNERPANCSAGLFCIHFLASLFKGSFRRLPLPDRHYIDCQIPAWWSFLDSVALLFRQSVSGSYLM